MKHKESIEKEALVHNILELYLIFYEEVVKILDTNLQSRHFHLVVRNIKPFPRGVVIISREAMLRLSKANAWHICPNVESIIEVQYIMLQDTAVHMTEWISLAIVYASLLFISKSSSPKLIC